MKNPSTITMDKLFTFESIARWADYHPIPASPFHHINTPPVDHQRSRIQRLLCDPHKDFFLTPSIVRCAPTSLPMNSIYFLTRKVKRGLLVPTGSATDDSEASLLTTGRSHVEWSGSTSSWVVPSFIGSPILAAVRMNGSSMSPDHHCLYSNVNFSRLITCFARWIFSPYLSSACSCHGDDYTWRLTILTNFSDGCAASEHVHVRPPPFLFSWSR